MSANRYHTIDDWHLILTIAASRNYRNQISQMRFLMGLCPRTPPRSLYNVPQNPSWVGRPSHPSLRLLR